MIKLGLAAALLVAWAAPLSAQKFDKLEFMTGCWRAQTGKDEVAEETWSNPVENVMVGYTRYLAKDSATGWDFNHVRKTDSAVVLVLSPRDQPADTFRLKTLVDEFAVWQREGTKFPGLVMYRKASDGALIARLEAPPGVSQPSVEVRFLKAKCPGQK
jgi:hypothetical protein